MAFFSGVAAYDPAVSGPVADVHAFDGEVGELAHPGHEVSYGHGCDAGRCDAFACFGGVGGAFFLGPPNLVSG